MHQASQVISLNRGTPRNSFRVFAHMFYLCVSLEKCYIPLSDVHAPCLEASGVPVCLLGTVSSWMVWRESVVLRSPREGTCITDLPMNSWSHPYEVAWAVRRQGWGSKAGPLGLG